MPVTNKFVEQPLDTVELEHALLPQQHNRRQKIFVLYGLGRIGKTQLAVDFARRHHRRFSSVFWLDGRSGESLKQSIANYADKIPEGQISETSRNYVLNGEGNIKAVVREVMHWLTRPDNTDWLLIFDNVDQGYYQHNPEPGAYNITRYLPGNHGSVLITTRLSQLAQVGDSRRLSKVDEDQARSITEVRIHRIVQSHFVLPRAVKRLEVGSLPFKPISWLVKAINLLLSPSQLFK
jgi:hypothetical protein